MAPARHNGKSRGARKSLDAKEKQAALKWGVWNVFLKNTTGGKVGLVCCVCMATTRCDGASILSSLITTKQHPTLALLPF